MRSFSILLCFIVSHFIGGQALSLLDALKKNADASQFAQTIEDNPQLAAIFLSPSTHTVFAPSDDAIAKLSIHSNNSLVSRQSGPSPSGSYQACRKATNISSLGIGSGQVLDEQPDPNDDAGASVVDDLSTQTNPVNNHAGSRKIVSNPPGPLTVNITKRTSQPHNITKQHVQIFSGLGNAVNIIKGDIPYDGGLIQVVDGYFTIPQTFSKTTSQKNHTGFAGLVNRANLTSTLDSSSEVTVFIPTNEAIQRLSGNITRNASALTTLLANHVITGFAGYLPYLVDGASYTTTLGTNISVSIKNGEYFIDGARIVNPNLITTNGVAHVIDQFLFPKKGSPPPARFTSAGGSSHPNWALFLALGLVLTIGLKV